MTEEKKMLAMTLVMATVDGDQVSDAWVPFVGAEFCAHRDGREWAVSHVRSGFKIPMSLRNTRAGALALAGELHDGCPTATAVTRAKAMSGKLPRGFVKQAKAVLVAA